MQRDMIVVDRSEFWYWINERHWIYLLRRENQPRPWSEDPIFQQFKFTNAFRELDRGTLLLRRATAEFFSVDAVFATFAYRMINRTECFEDVGFPTLDKTNYAEWKERIRRRWHEGLPVFTDAHMTVGRPGELKIDTVIDTLDEVYAKMRENWALDIFASQTLEGAFKEIKRQKFYGIGAFINYEIVSDLRWIHGMWKERHPTDVLTWANIGPGCRRGLLRLGMEPVLDSLRELYEAAGAPDESGLEPHVIGHYNHGGWSIEDGTQEWPPFEMREIEHSLCEFDKYQRVKHGQGFPRKRFNGVSE